MSLGGHNDMSLLRAPERVKTACRPSGVVLASPISFFRPKVKMFLSISMSLKYFPI